jgi:putative endopeptidase
MNKKISSLSLTAAAVALLLTACQQEDKTKLYEANDPVIHNMDKAVKPGDDFFKYANGAWLSKILSRRPIHHGVLAT